MAQQEEQHQRRDCIWCTNTLNWVIIENRIMRIWCDNKDCVINPLNAKAQVAQFMGEHPDMVGQYRG